MLSSDKLQLEPYRGYNIFSTLLSYFNVVWQSINDPFHEISNTVKDIFRLLMSSDADRGKGMKFSAKRKAYEVDKLGRFQGGRPPFQASRPRLDAIDSFVKSSRFRLPSCWPAIPSVFEGFGKLKGAERLLLAGPLGAYFLQFVDCRDDIKDLLVTLLMLLAALMSKTHTRQTVDTIERKLRRVLAELEGLLPTYWTNSVKHHLLHLPDFIRRCGPFKTHSMLVFERFHTIFKKLVRNSKLSCMTASIANNYSRLVNTDFWCLRRGGVAPASASFRSTLSGSVNVDWGGSVVKPLTGKRVHRTLSDRKKGQLQDMYATRNQTYNLLRKRYRQDMKSNNVRSNSGVGRKRQRAVYDAAQLPSAWVPTDGLGALTATEQSWLSMTTDVECVTGATVNTFYTFRTQKSELTNNTDNSAIKATRYSRQGVRGAESNTACYAWIVDMFVHRVCPESDELVVCEGNWANLLPTKSKVGQPVVRIDPGSYFNTNGKFVALVDCAPYNLALLPNSLTDPDCTEFSVVDRGY